MPCYNIVMDLRVLKRLVALGIAGILPFLLLITLQPATATPIRLDQNASLNQQSFLIHLHQQADLRSQLPHETIARRAEIIQRLQTIAIDSQKPILQQLNQWQKVGRINHIQPLWIINGIAVSGDPATILQLASSPDVRQITLDTPRQYLPLTLPEESLLQALVAKPLAENNPIPEAWGINKINAPQAWHGLGAKGNGVTVAIMDTGVDWEHPLLAQNYRGTQSGDHAGNWYDPIDATTVPTDPVWHGTHVAGTAVGQAGIGVAPNANWIATRIFDENGFTTNAIIHLAFQWLLAPDGDPTLAPDIVNASWSGPGESIDFLPDVTVLQNAGILPIFAMGNNGPYSMSVGAPASYTSTVGVGATDWREQITWFSSRGASPLHNQPTPLLVAPGAGIISAYPDGNYAFASGTSMATPHVVGAVALLKGANPTLANDEILHILTDTAKGIQPLHPNPSAGWGEIDVAEAVGTAMNASIFSGNFHANNIPFPNLPFTITTPNGQPLLFQTDENGNYRARLSAGIYQLTAHPFGYQPVSQTVQISNGINQQDFEFLPSPTSMVSGIVYDMDSSLPIADLIVTVAGKPVTTQTDANGAYQLQLPAGNYTITLAKVGYRYTQSLITLSTGNTVQLSPQLEPLPKILFIDDSGWYYHVRGEYFTQALHEIRYTHDTITIFNPFTDVPDLSTLQAYDVVIWSSPDYSPGYILGGDLLHQYLESGGKLLISGQNVPFYETMGAEQWFLHDMGLSYDEFAELPYHISGIMATPFAGISVTLNSGESDDNQNSVNSMHVWQAGKAEPLLHLANGSVVGARGGYCQPFDGVALSFGLEGVGNLAQRADLLQRGFDSLFQPLRHQTARYEPSTLFDFAPPGAVLTYSVALRNSGGNAHRNISTGHRRWQLAK